MSRYKSNVKYVEYVKKTNKWRVKLKKYVTEALPHFDSSGTFTHREDAEDRARIVSKAYLAWKAGDLTSIDVQANTVMSLITAYRQTRQFRENIDAQTRRDYEIYFGIACKYPVSTKISFGQMLIHNVTADVVDRLQRYVEKNYSYNCSYTTVSRLRTAWLGTERHGLWRVNPFVKMGLKRPPARQIAWDADLTNQMLKICDDEGYQSIATLMIICLHFAQRIGDMRKLEWGHIDFDFVCPSTKKTKTAFRFTQQKTGQDMMLYATPLIEERLKLHHRSNTDDFVFRNDGDDAKKGARYMAPYTADLLRKRFLKLRRKYGLGENLWLSDFRRTAATALADAGATEAEIMSSTGHASPEVLRRVYLIKNANQAEIGAKKRGIA